MSQEAEEVATTEVEDVECTTEAGTTVEEVEVVVATTTTAITDKEEAIEVVEEATRRETTTGREIIEGDTEEVETTMIATMDLMIETSNRIHTGTTEVSMEGTAKRMVDKATNRERLQGSDSTLSKIIPHLIETSK